VSTKGFNRRPNSYRPDGMLSAAGSSQARHRLDEVLHGWPVVWAVTPKSIDQNSLGINHKVSAELQAVLDGSSQILQRAVAENVPVATRRPPTPHSPDRTSSEPVRLVCRSVRIRQYWNVEVMHLEYSMSLAVSVNVRTATTVSVPKSSSRLLTVAACSAQGSQWMWR
jgi:hypothetical protein